MGKVIVQASMSLDGFIADTEGRVGPLFDWYSNGDVAFTGGTRSGRSTFPRLARTTCARHGRT